MLKHPVLRALAAGAYIVGVVAIMAYAAPPDTPDTIVTPIVALSLLVLSVAFMAYIFFYEPVMLLLDGKREDAVRYFFATLATFAVFVVALLLFNSFIFPLLSGQGSGAMLP